MRVVLGAAIANYSDNTKCCWRAWYVTSLNSQHSILITRRIAHTSQIQAFYIYKQQ